MSEYDDPHYSTGGFYIASNRNFNLGLYDTAFRAMAIDPNGFNTNTDGTSEYNITVSSVGGIDVGTVANDDGGISTKFDQRLYGNTLLSPTSVNSLGQTSIAQAIQVDENPSTKSIAISLVAFAGLITIFYFIGRK